MFWVLVKQGILSRELGLVIETNVSKMEKELEIIDRGTKGGALKQRQKS